MGLPLCSPYPLYHSFSPISLFPSSISPPLSTPRRFYWILYLVCFVLLPINAPLEYWDDTVQAALFVAFSLRYIIVINIAWLVNSAHLLWGLNKDVKQSDSNLIFIITKSYWPQYHYLVPWDYQTGEFGNYGKQVVDLRHRQTIFLGAAAATRTEPRSVSRATITFDNNLFFVHGNGTQVSLVNRVEELRMVIGILLPRFFSPDSRDRKPCVIKKSLQFSLSLCKGPLRGGGEGIGRN